MNPSTELLINLSGQIVSTNSITVDSRFVTEASVQIVSGNASIQGLPFLQSSNDIVDVQSGKQATNWTTIAYLTSITTPGVSFIPTTDVCSRELRLSWNNTSAGVQTVAPVADSAGSLNNKYFFLNSQADTTHYYVWMNINSAGVDPALPGKTGIEIDAATNASAATIGAAMASAITAVNSGNDFVATGTTLVTITNVTTGDFTAASDHNTGFAFAVTAPVGSLQMILHTAGS